MFAIIDTKGANKIAIHIPHQGAEKTLPALAAMLEQNATFIKSDYYGSEVTKPEMSIVLGDMFDAGSEKPSIHIAASGSVIGEDFVIDSPEVRVSYSKILSAKDKELERMRIELSAVKMARDQLQEQVNALSVTQD